MRPPAGPEGAVQLVTPAFGWVLTPDALLTTHDGGATFSTSVLPLPSGPVRAATFRDAADGTAAAADGDTIVVARTADGGRSGKTSRIRDGSVSPAGYSAVAVSFGDERNGAILARTATSQAFSLATLFATTDGGASWSARPAPEAGQVRVEPGGRTWVAGDTLDATGDQGRTWTRAEVRLSAAAGTATFGTPIGSALPVTVAGADRTSGQVLTSTDDGRSWDAPAVTPVQAKTGPGVRIPVADTGTGLVVFDPAGGHAYQARTGADLHPAGLPEGVAAVTFAPGGTAGWALAAHGTCASGKQNCVLRHDLVATADAGATWRPVATWAEPAG